MYSCGIDSLRIGGRGSKLSLTMLHQKLKEDLKEAMRAKDAFRMNVLRGLLSACTNENVAKRRKPDVELSDEDALAVLTRAARQRKDSIEQFTAGGRTELTDNERRELALIGTYLPQMMSEVELRPLAVAKKEAMGAHDPSQKGLLMGALMKDLKDKADGGTVKTVVDALFA